MYVVEGNDSVHELKDVPLSCTGAPCPAVLSDEHALTLLYYVHVPNPEWDGNHVTSVDPAQTIKPVAVIRFAEYISMMFGFPNDEAFVGHPLFQRGLKQYGAYEVRGSSWIRALAKIEHVAFSGNHFGEGRHFILAFHDSTFECVARRYSVETRSGPLKRVLADLAADAR